MATRILTWNLQGRERPDLGQVAAAIASFGPDVIALQEVQRRQARAVARRLGCVAVWRFKHWPLVVPPEGMALLALAPPVDVATVTLAHGWRFWSWRRRIAVRATVAGPDGLIAVVVAHLGAGVGDEERSRQAVRTLEAAGTGPGVVGACIAGDLNTRPGSAVLAAYEAGGFRDAWADEHPGTPVGTHWSRGPRDEAPTRRLDYVLVDGALEVEDAHVPAVGEPGSVRWAALSDHLPVVVSVSPRSGRTG